MKLEFTNQLLKWNTEQNKRSMPWKGQTDPYKIWLSEVILQQTRVQQGIAYYENFVSAYPTVTKLAHAADEEVFKLWEGLGYYSRCKNLLHSARYIENELGGTFPYEYKDILALKGVGTYTAAAIASFAYGHLYAVLDGNVFRVLARYFGKAWPVDSKAGKDQFTLLAQQLLYKKDSGTYNQAIMDFGATLCKPQIPECGSCIMNSTCIAYKTSVVNKLPVKEKRLIRRNRYFCYFLFYFQGFVLVNRREEKDIWQGLFEFYLFEADKVHYWSVDDIKKWMYEQLGVHNFHVLSISPYYRQQLTHQNIHSQFISINLKKIPDSLRHMQVIPCTGIHKLAFPKIINRFLENKVMQTQLL